MRLPVLALAICAFACSKHPDDMHGSAWKRVGIGSVFVMHSVTRMTKPFERVTESTMKQTLLGRTATDATVKLEITEGTSTSTHDETLSLHDDPVQVHDGSTVTTAEEVCTVPAGTFPCTKTSFEVTQGDATRSTVTWTSKTIPVPLRTIVTTDNMTVTTELTSVTLAH